MVLDTIHRLVHDVVHVDELLQLLIDENAAGLVHVDGAPLLLLGQQLLQHLREVDIGPLHPLGRLHHLEPREALLLDLDLHVTLLERPRLELLPQLVAGATAPLL